MISNRRYILSLIRSERERTNLLFAIAAAVGIYTYRELERRQRLREAEDEIRRKWEDEQFASLRDSELGHRERSQGVRNIGKFMIGSATIIVGVVAVVGLLLSSHAI